jgi:pyruvate kinase
MKTLLFNLFQTPNHDSAHSFAASVVEASLRCNAKSVIVSTSTEATSKNVATFRPKCPIIDVGKNVESAKKLHLYRGILPLVVDGEKGRESIEKD